VGSALYAAPWRVSASIRWRVRECSDHDQFVRQRDQHPQRRRILASTAISVANGQLERHLWSADNRIGLCRIDPDLAASGPHAINTANCIHTASGIRLAPGQLTYDHTW
jgi:hypothetical protein